MKIFESIKDPEVAELLSKGGVGVLPTDTLYGVVASAGNPAAVSRLYELKSRYGKTGTVIAASIDQLVALGLKRRYLTAVAQFWPGAVSVENHCGPELEYLHQGTGRFAVRIPDVEQLRMLLERTGPLLTSSANLAGMPPSTTIAQAQAYFGESVDFYVDGGDLSGNLPSTVVKIVDDAIVVERQGAVKLDDA